MVQLDGQRPVGGNGAGVGGQQPPAATPQNRQITERPHGRRGSRGGHQGSSGRGEDKGSHAVMPTSL
jgi:hypothetical protein